MSSSDPVRVEAGLRRCGANGGFTLIEILLGLSLALTLALGVASLWGSFQSIAVEEGDKTIWALQARVAGARLERDLRLAGVGDCPFESAGALLQATSSQIVLLVLNSGSASSPIIVEWELVNRCLMRRWGVCPATRPSTFDHSLYSDNKTMLEHVDMLQSGLSYSVSRLALSAPTPPAELCLVDQVTAILSEADLGGAASPAVAVSGSVGR